MMAARLMRLPLCILLAVFSAAGPRLASACACTAPGSTCLEVAAGSMVFIGKVESITPQFLDHWNPARRKTLADILDADGHGVESVKNIIREKLPDLPPQIAQRLAAAKTHEGVIRAFDEVLTRGRIIRFHVSTVFAKGDDDDDDDNKKDDDDDNVPSVLDITTPFDDCGYDFQQGETYLVYASRDEDSPVIETSKCTATKRLSDAGRDLPYLYLYKNDSKAAARLDGAVTYDSKLNLRTLGDDDPVSQPADGVVVGLTTGSSTRYTIASPQGRFVFDGLASGNHTLNIWAPGYPDNVRLLSGPTEVPAQAKSCLNRTFVLPNPSP